MNLKEQIMQYMLRLIALGDKNIVSKTVEYFNKSKSTIYNYLKEMCELGLIEKSDSGYSLITQEFSFFYNNDGSLSESRICSSDIDRYIASFPKNVVSIWRYAFMEMMNNAIGHSEATEITVFVRLNCINTQILIEDNGVGIFKNIQRFMKKEHNENIPLEECVTMLFAGKFTTAKQLHSGEGIFFTSHMMDDFLIVSDGMIFSRNNFKDERSSSLKRTSGTLVSMSLSNNTLKTSREIFDRFSNVDDGFIKTSIPIAHIFGGCDPISRSEARRLGELISNFKEVELDFLGNEEVGQAFVHELFVVWQRNNPDVKLMVTNACENVDFMIRRVINTK